METFVVGYFKKFTNTHTNTHKTILACHLQDKKTYRYEIKCGLQNREMNKERIIGNCIDFLQDAEGIKIELA